MMASRRWEGDDDEPRAAMRRAPPRVGDDLPRAGGPLGVGDTAGPGGDGADTATAEEPQKTQPSRRKRNVLSESHLLGPEGFKKIYETFPFQVSGGVAVGQEAKALSSLLKMYKQWAYDLYPGLNFEDFVDRTEALGKTQGVQGLMSDLRNKEMRRALGLPVENSSADQVDADTIDDHELDPEASGFIAPGGDVDDGDDDYSEEEAML